MNEIILLGLLVSALVTCLLYKKRHLKAVKSLSELADSCVKMRSERDEVILYIANERDELKSQLQELQEKYDNLFTHIQTNAK